MMLPSFPEIPPQPGPGVGGELARGSERSFPQRLLASIFVALGFTVVFGLLGLVATLVISRIPIPGESADAIRALIGTLLVELLLIGAFVLLVRRLWGPPLMTAIRWSRSYEVGNGRLILLGMGLAFGAMAVSAFFPPSDSPIERLLRTPESIVIFALFGVVFAPFFEELTFRGFLFRALEDAGGPALAVPFTAVLFALPHVPQLGANWHGVLVIFAVGYVLSELRRRTGSLIPSFIVHTAYNGMLVLGLALSALVQGSMQ